MLTWAARGDAVPAWLPAVAAANLLSVREIGESGELLAAVRRGRPAALLLVASSDSRSATSVDALLDALKRDAYTGVVPVLVAGDRPDAARWLERGADDVIANDATLALAGAQVAAALRRSVRDLAAQPTTRLPGASAIDAEIERRIAGGAGFAACYADLDHFKEFNDRYGFREGDRVIRMVARVLHDCAVGVLGSEGFVGHIGGDDFMLILPLERAAEVCELAIEVFDLLAPLQYSEADRRAGYYFGKDRRGQLHRVPLMTLSIGAATNERRRLASAAEVARLASEMKSFAKARAGSVFAVDRRGEEEPAEPRRPAASRTVSPFPHGQ